MAKYARGLICVSISEQRAEKLSLNLMEKKILAFMKLILQLVLIKSKIQQQGFLHLIDPKLFEHWWMRIQLVKTLQDLDIFSPDCWKGGESILRRAGHTEASMDLAEMAGLKPSGVICEIMAEDGNMLRGKDLDKFPAKFHKLKIISIEDLIRQKRKKEKLITKIESVNLPTDYGKFKFHLYQSEFDEKQHMALTHGNYKDQKSVLVRVPQECLTGDVFLSKRCDCGSQLDSAMKEIVKNGSGVIIYLKQEGRRIGLKHKIKAYKLQEDGLDTVEAMKIRFPA